MLEAWGHGLQWGGEGCSHGNSHRPRSHPAGAPDAPAGPRRSSGLPHGAGARAHRLTASLPSSCPSAPTSAPSPMS